MHRGVSAAIVALAVAAFVAPADEPDATQARLEKIKKVGREGGGNADAAKAWKALVAQGTPAMLPILGAMDYEDKTSENWLRPAFEAIAEKAQEAGKLPKAELEKFVNDTKKAGNARRLAYEWLVKADDTAPARLLPKMLLDANLEMRRDAVDLAIKEAEAIDAKKEDAAKAAYRRALKGACDQDQVDLIAKALEKLKDKVDLAKHFGFVTSWHLVAPFEHSKGVGWDKIYPPEKGVDLAASYDGKGGVKADWKAHTTSDAYGAVDLNAALDKHKGAIAYAYAVVESPEERTVEFRAASKNGLKIFLNGKQIFAREEYHHLSRMDQYAARGTLKKGKNTILLKVAQNEQTEKWAQDWNFQLRLTDFTDSAVPFTQPEAKKESK